MSQLNGHLVVLSGMVTDLIASISLPIVAFHSQDARPMTFEAGASANVMIAAARLGLHVSALGALGDDPAGLFLRSVLDGEGIFTAGIAHLPGTHSPMTLALIDHDQKQHVFIGHVGDGPAANFSEAMQAVLESADALFWQGYTLHETQTATLVSAALTIAQSRQIPVFFDSGPTLQSIPPDRIRAAVETAAVVKMTEDELPLVANGLQGKAAHEYLLDLGVETLVVTRGGQGCDLIRLNYQEHIPGFSASVVDTVGAGDAFSAGYLYGLLHHWEPRRCALLANAMGAAAVQKAGAGRNVPTCAEVQTILKRADAEVQLPC